MELKRTWNGLLAQIREFPGMFLGTQNLQAFQHFRNGVELAGDLYEVPNARREVVDDFPWCDFERYVEDRYNAHRISLNSFGLAQFVAQGQDIHVFDMGEEYPGAWDQWWTWFDEFVAHQTSV